MWCAGDKLQVVSVHGAYKEELGLYTKLEAHPSASTWLRGLESILKNTMTVVLQACVQARMEEGKASHGCLYYTSYLSLPFRLFLSLSLSLSQCRQTCRHR